MTNLRQKITGPIERCLSHELREVWYDCLPGETDGTNLEYPALYIGGEVRLCFNKAKNIVISWDENAGWNCHFSLIVAEASVFNPGTLQAWSATPLHPWSEVMGKRLLSARVYGYDGTPHILRLSFDSNINIFIGDGSQQIFGDGDDVLIRSSENMIDLSDWDLLWSGAAT